MTRRARSLAVVAILVAGAAALIASTQTWIDVTLAAGVSTAVAVSGAAAAPVLAPLSLAVLALGAALSIVGLVLRYVFGVLAVGAAVALGMIGVQIAAGPPLSAYGPAVTEASGITGESALSGLVVSAALSAWPFVVVAASVLLLAGGLFTLVTARRWRSGGRKYNTGSPRVASSGPLDPIDSWDELSRGSDPTTPG